jgi:hypothetical protein
MDMHSLSPHAAAVLVAMEPGRAYRASELAARFPDLSMDGLRALMHELWVTRHVERFGPACWRRQESECGVERPADEEQTSVDLLVAQCSAHPVTSTGEPAVRPELLFDYSSFPPDLFAAPAAPIAPSRRARRRS